MTYQDEIFNNDSVFEEEQQDSEPPDIDQVDLDCSPVINQTPSPNRKITEGKLPHVHRSEQNTMRL